MIRKMRIMDVEQVAAIEKEIFADPWSEQSFQHSMKVPQNLYLVVEENDKILAYCGLWGVAEEGQICNVAVKEEERGRGLATMMLSELLKQGSEMGIKAFTLEVRVSNASAIHVYKKLGFETAGVRKNYYTKPNEDALIMWYYL